MMKKNPRLLSYRGLIPSFFLLLTGAPESRASSAFLEPMLSGGMGSSSIPSATELISSFGGGLRFGLENQELFSALEFNGAMANIGSGDSGKALTLGVTAGGTLIYLPLRLWVGFDFMDSYSDSLMSASGYGFRMGISYFLNLNMSLGLQYTNHTYPDSSTGFSYNGLGLVFSMPIALTQPKEPWKTKYLKEQSWKKSESQAEEAPDGETLSNEAPGDEPLPTAPADDSGPNPEMNPGTDSGTDPGTDLAPDPADAPALDSAPPPAADTAPESATPAAEPVPDTAEPAPAPAEAATLPPTDLTEPTAPPPMAPESSDLFAPPPPEEAE